MSGFGWLGVISSSMATTLALGAWIVMSMPYLDNAPYLTDLRRSSSRAMAMGTVLFLVFFSIFLFGAHYLDEDTSGPLMVFAGAIIALPISMLLGSETWEHYHPKGMDRTPGPQAIAIATGIGMAELVGFAVIVIALLQI